jgi:hypothetical protein
MISVLVPSRRRAVMLAESIRSLGTEDIEILVYVDNDDPQMDGYISLTSDIVTILIGKRYGYTQLHEYYNTLARLSKGDWLMVWNDDAEMMTPGWTKLLHRPIQPEVINFDTNKQNNLFPLISRQMYQAMGHYSLSAHNDSWVQDIANNLKIHTYIDGVNIKHHRDIIDDDTKAETQAAYATTSPLHYSDELQKLMAIDMEKIKEEL